jgi:Cache 3/Cache 2 fusion domain
MKLLSTLKISLAAVGLILGAVTFTANAQSDKVKTSMQALVAEANKLGAPRAEGDNLYFGTTKINGDYTVVDSIKAKHGGTATLFIKKGNSFIRVSTNVMKGAERAVGTPLDPNGPAIAANRQGNAYYGIVDILGKLFDTGYEPIKTAKGEVIGIYYVGYLME